MSDNTSNNNDDKITFEKVKEFVEAAGEVLDQIITVAEGVGKVAEGVGKFLFFIFSNKDKK